MALEPLEGVEIPDGWEQAGPSFADSVMFQYEQEVNKDEVSKLLVQRSFEVMKTTDGNWKLAGSRLPGPIESESAHLLTEALTECYVCACENISEGEHDHKNVFEYIEDSIQRTAVGEALADVPQVGEKTKKRLMEDFDSLEALQRADRDELLQYDRITERNVEAIKSVRL